MAKQIDIFHKRCQSEPFSHEIQNIPKIIDTKKEHIKFTLKNSKELFKKIKSKMKEKINLNDNSSQCKSGDKTNMKNSDTKKSDNFMSYNLKLENEIEPQTQNTKSNYFKFFKNNLVNNKISPHFNDGFEKRKANKQYLINYNIELKNMKLTFFNSLFQRLRTKSMAYEKKASLKPKLNFPRSHMNTNNTNNFKGTSKNNDVKLNLNKYNEPYELKNNLAFRTFESRKFKTNIGFNNHSYHGINNQFKQHNARLNEIILNTPINKEDSNWDEQQNTLNLGCKKWEKYKTPYLELHNIQQQDNEGFEKKYKCICSISLNPCGCKTSKINYNRIKRRLFNIEISKIDKSIESVEISLLPLPDTFKKSKLLSFDGLGTNFNEKKKRLKDTNINNKNDVAFNNFVKLETDLNNLKTSYNHNCKPVNQFIKKSLISPISINKFNYSTRSITWQQRKKNYKGSDNSINEIIKNKYMKSILTNDYVHYYKISDIVENLNQISSNLD